MKLLIIDDLHPVFMEMLTSEGIAFDYIPQLKGKQELMDKIVLYEGIIVRSKVYIDKEIMDVAKKLRIIARAGAGMDNIDEEYAKVKGIVLVNAPEGNRDAVAEHAVGLLLNLFRNINRADREIRNRVWSRESNRGVELMGKTVGIIGYGNTGKAFAKKLSGFDVRVLACDKYLKNFSDDFAIQSDLKTIQEEADIISMHIPLTPETESYVNAQFLQGFRKSIYLINTARGKVMDTSHLVEGLLSGRILGAVLDVLENEQLDRLTEAESERLDALLRNENVILSPHIAGWTNESYEKISRVLARKIIGTLKAS